MNRMNRNNPFRNSTLIALSLTASLTVALVGCRPPQSETGVTTIQNKGSDTMVNLAQAWAEAYHEVKPDV
ncbi:MAG: hypothetical protein D6766_13520, partial [Verrucomicrobia bacterium]